MKSRRMIAAMIVLAAIVFAFTGCVAGGGSPINRYPVKFPYYSLDLGSGTVGQATQTRGTILTNSTDEPQYLAGLIGLEYPYELVTPVEFPLLFQPTETKTLKFRIAELEQGYQSREIFLASEKSVDRMVFGASTYDNRIILWARGITPGNEAPVVNAGEDRVIEKYPVQHRLHGTVSDDGIPGTGVSFKWKVESGPKGTYLFDYIEDPDTLDPWFYSTMTGTVILSLTARDGELETVDRVVLTVID